MEERGKKAIDKLVRNPRYNPRTKRLEFSYKRERKNGVMQDIYGYQEPDGSYSVTIDNNIQDWELEELWKLENQKKER